MFGRRIYAKRTLNQQISDRAPDFLDPEQIQVQGQKLPVERFLLASKPVGKHAKLELWQAKIDPYVVLAKWLIAQLSPQ